MKELLVISTDDTPEVYFHPSENKFEINGRSMPENVIDFYQKIFTWFDDYFKNPNVHTHLKFKMTFINSASTKQFFTLIKKINTYHLKGNNIKVSWYYTKEDEDIKELGEEFKRNIEANVELIEY